MENKIFQDKIIALQQKDWALRESLIQKGNLADGYDESMERLHIQNAKALDEIIDVIGYPSIENVGKEAADAAWVIIQHSISLPVFMKKCLKLLQVIVETQNENQRYLVYLSDRIAVLEEAPQVYGTQFDWDENGLLSPNYIIDNLEVNKRRAAIGLPSIEKQTEIMRAQVTAENQKPPADFLERKQIFNEWRRKVGWI